ncbi:host-nuclease inhibitor Gam family protein [Delftia sp. WSY_4]|uniref:host-nuclease inhibitor Gam family protein n=1 Tax=unclassified Delftia TaxID=2613839 RepID=UPI00370C227C
MATRLKAQAQTAVPQSKNDCAGYIRQIGDLQREFERRRGEMNDAIAAITQNHQPTLEALSARITLLQEGVQSWCEAHRVELCGENDKLGKTANFVTGTASWRLRPTSVSIRGAETVIKTLERMNLQRFVRNKAEVNKEAILNEPEAVRGIVGIKLVSGVEDFIVQPFEAKAEV